MCRLFLFCGALLLVLAPLGLCAGGKRAGGLWLSATAGPPGMATSDIRVAGQITIPFLAFQLAAAVGYRRAVALYRARQIRLMRAASGNPEAKN